MKNLKHITYKLALVIGMIITSLTAQAQVLDLESTTEGALLPRMTTAQRTAITSPSQSETVYDTDTKSFWYWEDTMWNQLGASETSTISFLNCGEGISGDTLSSTLPAVRDTITLTSTEMIMDDTHVSICLDIDHTFAGDLEISLISPSSGATIDLSLNNGSNGDNFKGTCFSVTAKSSITSVSSSDAPFTGAYLPEGSFSSLIGQPINGDWTLDIVDEGGGDDGILNSWTINFTNSFSIISQNSLFTNYAKTANIAKTVEDTDGDTKIQVEESNDEDVIRFDLGGSQELTLKKAPNNDLIFDLENSNVLLGAEVGENMAGARNINIGFRAGKTASSGNNNTIIGPFSGENVTTGASNTYLGVQTAQNNATGSNNVMIGVGAGENSMGSNNVFIGSFAGATETTNQKLYIEGGGTSTSSPLIYGEFDNNVLKFNGTIEADFHVQNASAFFGEDTSGLPSSFGKGIRVYIEQPSDKGRIFAYDYMAGAAMDLSLQAPGGNVAIGGTFATGYRFSVDGKIACEEVLVDLSGDWPDYVFQSDYKLKTLEEVEKHIDRNGHLPGVPSAKEVESNGIQVGEMNKILMEKIEELTLYILQQEKRIKALENSK